MPLDNRLQKRRLASDTYQDDMSADKTESPLNTIIPVLAASAGLYAMYKKGLLQPLIKSGMEVFESVAKNSTDKAYMNLKGLEEWTKFENLAPDKLKEMGYRVPKDSIFRGKGINKLKTLGLDTVSEIEKGDIRLGYARKVINDTVEDVNQLKRLISENTKRVEAYRQKYYDSDLIVGMKELRRFSREVASNDPNAKLFVNEKATKEFINMHTLSTEEEKKLLKINGYRPVMLQDIMDTPEKIKLEEGSKFVYKPKQGAKINLQDNTGTQVYNSADELLNAMGNSDFRYMNQSGKTTNMIGDWENTKRLVLDKNILIDESGNILDLRMSDDLMKSIKETITKNFKIPGLGFNPLTSLFPSWTNARIRKPNFGMLSKDSIQPFITGKAGNKLLGEDLFVINGKAFKMADNGLEQVADNIVLNDISRAGQYGFNKKIDTTRKMADLNYYDFKLKDNIKQEIDNGTLKGKFYEYIDRANQWLDSGKPDNYVHKAKFNPDGERIDIDNEWAFNSDIDSFLTEKIHKFTSKLNMYEAVDNKTPENIFGEGPKDILNEVNNTKTPSRKFIATRKGMSLRDLKEQEGIENKISFTEDYLKQFFAGRNKNGNISELTTETSLRAYGLFDNVFGRLSAIAPQLGFGTESKGNLEEYIKNIALKRVLPIYMATQAPGILNALSEPIFNVFNKDEDGTDNKNNLGKFLTSNIVKPFDLGMHKVKDILGLTKLDKKIEEFTPGFDQINELPGIYQLGLNQTYKERKDYIENGYDPIRKARYWGMGNCVIPEQDIQCGYGITKKAKNVQVNDLVITHEGILKPVLHVFTRQMKNNEWTPEIELYTTIFNNITTDNHPYLAVKEKQCPSSSFKDCHPNRNSNTCNKCAYKACKKKDIWNPEWTLARNLKMGDYLAYPRIKILDIQKDINLLPANNEIGYLLGIFLAEGNIHIWHKNGKTYGIELTLNNAEINIANKVKGILDKYFPNTNTTIDFKKNSGNGVIRIRNLSTKVSEWFRSVLYQDREKHFIPNIYYYNKNFILSVITGLFDGDGHFSYKSNSLQLAYTSHRIEYIIQVRNLLYTLGYANSIVHCDKKLNGKNYTGYRLFVTGDNAIKLNKELDLYKTKGYTFNLSNINDKYTIIDDNYIYLKIKSIKDNGYRGIVYDYEIKDSHSFCSLSTIMHNTSFTGGKIMYWRPNLYRRIQADVDFSDSKWGSRQEYYSNTWYPNPVNPLAPINHFILDKNHYDKKHYYDRPYLLTSKEGNNIPIIGPLYSATIGNIVNPQKRMHEEYWDNNKPIEKDDENVVIVDYVNQATMYQRQVASNNAFINSNIITNVNNNYKISQSKDKDARIASSAEAQKVVQHNSAPQNIISGNILPTQTDNTFSSFVGNLSSLEIYTTPSGSTSLVDIPDTLTTWEANQRLKEYSIKRFPEADTRVTIEDEENKFNPQLADYTNEKINNAFLYNAGEEYNTLSDFFGMKGFEAQAFITGEANVDAKTIEDSNYAYSFNKSFWDENLGGFGGDASEIFRRFVQKRNNSTDYIDPVRNTIPSWMPGRNYFTDFKHGDPYSKIDNGEERLPGEGYERLAGINTKEMFQLGIGSSYIGKTKEDIQKHLLNQDSMDSFGRKVTEDGTDLHNKIEKQWLDSGIAINTEGRIEDKQNNILDFYDALVHDKSSKTGKAIVDIKTVGDKKFNKILQQGHPEFEHQSQVNYYLWATGNKKSNGYIYYVNRDNPEQTFTMGFNFNQDLLQQNLNTLNQARNEIYTGLENGTIGRGELYSNLDRYRILADVAPYSDEFQSIKARLANDPNITKEQQEEISQINERVKQQKEPLRVYPYKFKTSNLQNEKVTVKKVLDNNTILVDRYGVEHAIKLAGIHVSESNTDKYDKNTTMNEAASKELRKYIKRGKTITIGYDYDGTNKFKNDSTKSIRAVVYSNGRNVNKTMLNKGLATEKEDESPAGIHARYTKNEIAFGSAMERVTHFIGGIPFIGNKFFQVKSPYEQYRDREVYGKDFQSWNNPIRDYLKPEMIDKVNSHGNNGPQGIITSTVLGTFLGSLFGASKYGKMIGGLAGGTIGLVGGTYANTQKTKDKDWIPDRRKKQEELNEYFDTLKYVKNMGLYEKYKEKALKEDHVDVTKLEGSKELQGIYNKNKSNELKDFKKTVKLDYKHRKQFDFKYGAPENLDMNADAKSIIKSINQELTKIQSDRSVERVPENVVKAISYKQQADQTMYGYNVGDPLNNLMKALPKKERQYFKYFMKAPEEEKDKILRIAPEYLKRGLQQAWGMDVDEKQSLQQYFQTHGLPDASWVGWNENTNIEDVKVKLVHNNKLDMGEFDLWNDQINQANQTNIPIPKIRSQNSGRMVQLRLQSILGKAGYEDAVVVPYHNAKGNKNTLNVYQDSRDNISDAIYDMNI